MINEYEINQNTLALISVEGGITKVIEKNDIFYVKLKTTDIVDYSCKYFGSSLKGRMSGTKNILGYSYKLPIIVEESKSLIFFPTCSPNFIDCCWISVNNISSYYKKDYNSMVVFENGENIELDISYNTLENQVLRATRLGSVMRSRKKI